MTASTPVVTLRAMLDGFAVLGFDMGPLHTAMAPVPSGDAVPAAVFERLWQAAWHQRPDPTLPVALGLAIPYGAFGFTDYLAGSSDTVAGGIESLALHLRLVASGVTLTLDHIDDVHWVHIGAGDLGILRATSMSMTAAILVGRFGRATGSVFRPIEIHLPLEAPDAEEACAALLRAPVRCGMPRAAIAIDAKDWALPLRGADPYLRPVLLRALEATGLDISGDSDLHRAIRARLRDALPAGSATPTAIARLLGMSERTLQRRLAESDANFSDLVRDYRHTEATRLLSDTDLTLTEVAFRLGYAEHTSFTRAFRRWTGATPRAWRAARRPVRRVGRTNP